ncbi:endothelin-converting enzyme homolog [Anabrus simplex]|uniref:endothelin-converting enzyme homolog n=1 Tax=Anabrus simplex TaxID=316456 RepID=UPI0035A3D095
MFYPRLPRSPEGVAPPNRSSSQQQLVSIRATKYELGHKTRLERRLMVAVFILGILVFALIIALSIVYSDYRKKMNSRNGTFLRYSSDSSHNGYCNREECIETASSLLLSIDKSADPCQDFYQYACGNWPRAHPIPEGRHANSWFAERSLYLDRQMQDIMEDSNKNDEPEAMHMMRTFYKSCVDTENLESLELEPMQEILEEMGLSTQVPSAETAEGYDLAYSIGKAQKMMSMDLLIQLSVMDGYKDISGRILNVRPPSDGGFLALIPDPDEELRLMTLTAKQLLKANLVYMVQVLHYVGNWRQNKTAGISLIESTEAAAKIMLFEVALRNLTKKLDEEKPNYTRMTFAELNSAMNMDVGPDEQKINLEEYVRVLSAGLNNTLDYNSDIVIVSHLSYFKQLAKVLASEEMQSAQRYIWWHVVKSLIPYSPSKLQKMQRDFVESLYSRPLPQSPRSKICVREVKGLMPMAVGYGMAERHPLNRTIARVEAMLDDIRSSFYSLIHDVQWMDEATKRVTVDKAESVTSFIGYPEWLQKPGLLDQHYGQMDLQPGKYMRNALWFKEKSVKQFLEELGTSNNSTLDLWESIDPVQVNAFYTRVSNSIIIPAGILQIPFYGRGHEALNYGAIGAILGHELTHGFDSEGKDYDKHGKHVTWWGKNITMEYNKRAKCFVNQYDRFRLPGRKKISGQRTLAENIADNGGLREALLAYRRYLKRNGPEPKLAGLEEFSHEQLLFLGFANLWCQASKPAYDDAILRDRHSPAKFRVLGTLSNTPDFAKAWNCPANSTMNPKNKCIIW